MSGGPSLPSNPAPAYSYGGQPTADAGALQGTQNLPNYAAQNYPQFQSAVGGVTSGAYGAPAIQQAGNQALGASNNLYGLSGSTAGMAGPLAAAGQGQLAAGQSLVPYATQALGAGFDPQNANYNAQFGRQQQQSNVNNAAQGVASTPYAAGVTNQNDQNFDLNWQMQQLARQQQGATTAEGLLGQGNQDITTGANALNTAGGLYGAAGGLSTQAGGLAGTGAGLLQSVPNESLSALGALNTAGGQATGVDQQMIQDFLSYLSGGTSATNAGTSQYNAEANASLGQQGINAQQLSGLGSLLGGGLGGLNNSSNLLNFKSLGLF